jgi:hypothetical protein
MSEREWYAPYSKKASAIASSKFGRVKITDDRKEIELEEIEARSLAEWLLNEAFKP